MRFDDLIKVAKATVKKYSFTSCEQITEEYCPYALGYNNGGLVLPSADILYGVPTIDVWFNMMAYYDTKHLDYWLNAIDGYPYNYPLGTALQEMGYTGCQEHLLPFMQYTPVPENIACRKGTIMELMVEYNMVTAADLKVYLFILVVLGIFVNNYMSEQVLRIENEEEFVAARLFQGELDAVLTTVSGGNPGGFFMSGASQGDTYSSQGFYRSIQGQLTPDEFKQLLVREKIHVQKSTFIGNESPQVVAMKDALQLSDTYSKYLEKRDDRFAKVGQRVFDGITLGNSARKDFTWKNWINREPTQPTFVSFGNQSKPYEGWITQGGIALARFKPAFVQGIININQGGYNPAGLMSSASSAQVSPGVI